MVLCIFLGKLCSLIQQSDGHHVSLKFVFYMEDREGGREEEGREGRREGKRDEGMKKGKGKKYKVIRLLSSLQVSFHGFPITNSSSFPDVDSFSICNTTSHPLLRGALFPNPGNPGLAREGLPSSLLSSPTCPSLLSINPQRLTVKEPFNPEVWYFHTHSPLLACPPPLPFSPLSFPSTVY